MTPRQVIKLIDRHHPNNPTTALDIGMPLKYVGEGLYRKVYQVVGTDMILKFPKLGSDGKGHGLAEYNVVTAIIANPKYKAIKKHMPKFYHCDKITGVVVARKYKGFPTHGTDSTDRMDALDDKLKKVTGRRHNDMHGGNLGLDGRGTLKIIDAGYLFVS